MDDELTRSLRDSSAGPDPDPREVARSARLPEWSGTGLCAAAQADGVPCSESGRSCDICGRASKERLPGNAEGGAASSDAAAPDDTGKKPGEDPSRFLLDRAGL